MAFAGCTGDMIFAAGQIIASSIVRKNHQGTSKSPRETCYFMYELSTGSGFAGMVEVNVNTNGSDIVGGYRGAEHLAIRVAGMAFVTAQLFVKMKRDTVEEWQGEDVESYQPEH